MKTLSARPPLCKDERVGVRVPATARGKVLVRFPRSWLCHHAFLARRYVITHRFSLEPAPLGCVSFDHVVRDADEDPLVLSVLQLQRANISYQARVLKLTAFACTERQRLWPF